MKRSFEGLVESFIVTVAHVLFLRRRLKMRGYYGGRGAFRGRGAGPPAPFPPVPPPPSRPPPFDIVHAADFFPKPDVDDPLSQVWLFIFERRLGCRRAKQAVDSS